MRIRKLRFTYKDVELLGTRTIYYSVNQCKHKLVVSSDKSWVKLTGIEEHVISKGLDIDRDYLLIDVRDKIKYNPNALENIGNINDFFDSVRELKPIKNSKQTVYVCLKNDNIYYLNKTTWEDDYLEQVQLHNSRYLFNKRQTLQFKNLMEIKY